MAISIRRITFEIFRYIDGGYLINVVEPSGKIIVQVSGSHIAPNDRTVAACVGLGVERYLLSEHFT
jgi:hypothetical protein